MPPPYSIKWEGPLFDLWIKDYTGGVNMDDPRVLAFLDAVQAMDATHPLQKVWFVNKGLVGAAIDYKYDLVLVAGREWHQHIYVASGDVSPPMTWDVTDWWTITEIETGQRAIRDAAIAILAGLQPDWLKLDRKP